MKPIVFCATLTIATLTSVAAFADDAPVTAPAPARAKPKKKPAKVAPQTEAAAPANAEPAAPVPLETLPPPGPVASPAAAPAASVPTPAPATTAPPADADAQPSATSSDSSTTRIEVVSGRTQALGYAIGARVGHRMTNNVYLGGSAMVQTGVPRAIFTYQAFELGYDAKLGSARFMPYVGIGPMIGIPTEGDAKVQVKPVVYPGFALHYESDKSPLVAGADVRFLYLTENDATAFAFNFTAGVRF